MDKGEVVVRQTLHLVYNEIEGDFAARWDCAWHWR